MEIYGNHPVHNQPFSDRKPSELSSGKVAVEVFAPAILADPRQWPLRNWIIRRRSRFEGRPSGSGANSRIALRSASAFSRASLLRSKHADAWIGRQVFPLRQASVFGAQGCSPLDYFVL